MTENWNRRTWRLAGPVMAANVSIPLLGAVDTAVIGRLPGAEYMGGVAVGALIFTIVYHGCNFLRMGTTGLTAQSIGARDMDAVGRWFTRPAVMAVAIGLAMILLQVPILWLALAVVEPSDSVAPLSSAYYGIRVWGAPAALMNFVILGWFFGIQNARAALATQIFMNGLNIILDLWFVLGLGWGVDGVAYATLIAEVSAACLGLWLVRRNIRRLGGHLWGTNMLDPERLKRMFQVNSDIFVRGICVQTVFIIITSLGARLGDTVLAANAVLLNFFLFCSYALDGFANAVEALAGEAVGARNREHFRAAFRASSIWAGLFALGFTAVFAVLGMPVVHLLTTVPAVRAEAALYLPWVIIMPLVAVWSFQLDGVFIGSTWTAEMRNGMLASTALFALSVFILLPPMGNHALWASLNLWMLARAVTLGVFLPRLERQIGP